MTIPSPLDENRITRSTPASKAEIILSKLIPYFALGMIAVSGCTLMAVTIFEIPLRGSLATLLLVSAVFLLPALGLGLLISVVSESQFQQSLRLSRCFFLQ